MHVFNFNFGFQVLSNKYGALRGSVGCSVGRRQRGACPAAVWLFGRGLLGLIGIARREIKLRRTRHVDDAVWRESCIGRRDISPL